MIYVYGCIDIIVKTEVFERQHRGYAKEIGEEENVTAKHYDADLMCFRLGMDPRSAEDMAKCLSQKYNFSIPETGKTCCSDSVITELCFGPTIKCDWIEEIGNGAYGLKKYSREWNSKDWLVRFEKAAVSADKKSLHEIRKEVFESTQRICAKGSYEINGKTIEIEKPSDSIVYEKPVYIASDRPKYETLIEVLNEDCLSVARRLENENPLVLNMANRTTPGGGVKTGAGAQEECLFRSSNYFMSLYDVDDRYPMDRDFGGVYTPDVTVFRDLESKGYELLDKPFRTNFVAVAAIRNPELTIDGHLASHMEQGMYNKIQTVLNIAMLHNHTTLILSALGCGAFHNPPEDVARLFKEVLEEEPYVNHFKKIIFAIKKDHNDTNNTNYKAFEECFNRKV